MSWAAPRNSSGRLPPMSEPWVRESECLSLSVSTLTFISSFISPWLFLSFLSVSEWVGSENGPRLVQMTAERALNSIRLAGATLTDRLKNHWLDQQVSRSFPWPCFPLFVFPGCSLFLSHLQKQGSDHSGLSSLMIWECIGHTAQEWAVLEKACNTHILNIVHSCLLTSTLNCFTSALLAV